MSPFQYMQIAVSDGFQFYQQAPVFFFRRGQCPGDDSLVIGCAMLSRMHVIVFSDSFHGIYGKRAITPPSLNRLNTTLIGVSISVCCLSVYNLIHFPIGKRA